MNKVETLKLMSVMTFAYPAVELNEEQIALWQLMLKDIPFEKAQSHLYDHIRSNKFPPTIAEIIREDSEQFTDYDQLRLDTQTYLQQREEWQQKAIECPPHLSRKHLTAGSEPEDV